MKASRVGGLIGATIWGGVLLLLALFVGWKAGAFSVLAWAFSAWFVLTILLAVHALVWPRIDFRHRSFVLTEHGIDIHRGVIWKSRTSVPRSRVQHTDVNQGPIERSFGLGHLVIHTAGTISASVRLEGLNYNTALALRDILNPRQTADAV